MTNPVLTACEEQATAEPTAEHLNIYLSVLKALEESRDRDTLGAIEARVAKIELGMKSIVGTIVPTAAPKRRPLG